MKERKKKKNPQQNKTNKQTKKTQVRYRAISGTTNTKKLNRNRMSANHERINQASVLV